jgi:hypothetical protein
MPRFVLLAVATSLLAAASAAGHDRKQVGDVRLVIGWGDEPAFSGLKNAIEVDVADAKGQPVAEDASLAVDVSFGDQHVMLPLRPARGQPGRFRALLQPTRAGTYAFHITGTVKGQAIDATSTCSGTTFACVIDVADIQFPVKDPSAGQIADRMSRELARAGTATDAAGSARTMSMAALGGALVAIAVAFAVGRRSRKTDL